MYEYRVLRLSSAEELEEVLNEYAAQGWRCKFQYVVQGFGGFTSLIVTLEREVGASSDMDR
ncbi:MAG TPA: DUF4177 domain-containing protein [Symbiobacteriaceae bacterium]|nr:DUF4177 domain-containing protein [Symbiobacteriaceae bacterium]